MDRLACVDVPALPLQLLCRRHPGWADHPVAVVDRDKPQGLIEWVNEHARRSGVLPGQRYAAALALCPSLRAGEVPPSEVTTEVAAATERLRRFTPGVEPAHASSGGEAGVFWLDANGLRQLYPSLPRWGEAIRAALRRSGLRSVVVVGFDRFGTYAVARALPQRAVTVFAQPDDEREAMRRVPLDRIGLEPEVRDALARLGVSTAGGFLALPHEGILRRFGEAAHRLHRLGTGDRWAPLQPRLAEEPAERRVELDDAESDALRLTFLVKRELDSLIHQLGRRGEALAELMLTLTVEKHPPSRSTRKGALRGSLCPPRESPGPPEKGLRGESPRGGARRRSRTTEGVPPSPVGRAAGAPLPAGIVARLRPAEPTLDAVLLLGLVRLRLESLQLPAGVTRIVVGASGTPATREQLQLFQRKPRRDLAAAGRAIARLRALLGDEAVVRARLREGHLPEARFAWEPITSVVAPSPREVSPRPLVRRITARPAPLPPRPAREPDGWLLDGPESGPVERVVGPQVISGGWWQMQIDRDYYFAELRSGALCWVYYDRRRRRWFLQGRVA